MTDPALYPCFLGPYGENDELFERVLVELLRDHVFWRRNFHPEDPPAIPTHAAQRADYQAFTARMRRELHALTAALKRSVPFHSPRYIGHMASDLLLPGLLAQMVTLPYNPNNVVGDAAPVTLDMEISVGLQLARMLGYPDDETRPDCAFGCLTSGGTSANIQALRLALTQKCWPPALAAALRACGEDLVTAALPAGVVACDDWQLGNLPAATAIALFEAWLARLADAGADERARLAAALAQQRVESLGIAEFFRRHPQLDAPWVITPVTAHYSWPKAVKLLGLGSAQLRTVPERAMRMDADALDALLDQAQRQHQSVLMVVGVLGTTEFGTIDPIDRMVAARERSAATGLGFDVHVDAAWGGYLATLFRAADGSLLPPERVREGFAQFPGAGVHAAVAALAATDSVTVDPHKLGYLPYGAGAFICRDHRRMALLAEDADYVFDRAGASDYRAIFRALGRYTLEGSKAGAAAAAAYVTHRVLPLDREHFGRIPRETVLAAERFRADIERFAAAVADCVTVTVPFEPDSNLVCLALNPRGNHAVAPCNAFVAQLHERLRVDPQQPLQTKAFFGSITALRPAALGAHDTARILAALDLDPRTLTMAPQAQAGADDRLLILRHTLMNPFLRDEENDRDYPRMYLDYLAGLVRALCGAGEAAAVIAAPATSAR